MRFGRIVRRCRDDLHDKAIEILREALEEKRNIEFLKASGSKGVGVRLKR